MGIPDYQSIMLPLLRFIEDGKEHSFREAIEYISEFFNLSEEEKRMLLPSGQQPIVNNRTGWARTYLKKANLLESTKRSHFRITPQGLEVLKKNPTEINVKFLEQFPEFITFKNLKKEDAEQIKSEIEKYSQTPRELMELAHEEIKRNLAQELLNAIKNTSPDFFEKLVIDCTGVKG
jgi:restriction system protein